MGDERQTWVAILREGKAQVVRQQDPCPGWRQQGLLMVIQVKPLTGEVRGVAPTASRVEAGCKLLLGTRQKGPSQTVTELGLQQTAPKCSQWLQEPSLLPVGRRRGSNVNAQCSTLVLQLQPGVLPPARPGLCGAGVPPALEPLVWHVSLHLATCSVTRRQVHGWAFLNCWLEQTPSSEQMSSVRC